MGGPERKGPDRAGAGRKLAHVQGRGCCLPLLQRCHRGVEARLLQEVGKVSWDLLGTQLDTICMPRTLTPQLPIRKLLEVPTEVCLVLATHLRVCGGSNANIQQFGHICRPRILSTAYPCLHTAYMLNYTSRYFPLSLCFCNSDIVSKHDSPPPCTPAPIAARRIVSKHKECVYLEEVGAVDGQLRELRARHLRVQRVLRGVRPGHGPKAGDARVEHGRPRGRVLRQERSGRRVALDIVQLHLPRQAHLQLAAQCAEPLLQKPETPFQGESNGDMVLRLPVR